MCIRCVWLRTLQHLQPANCLQRHLTALWLQKFVISLPPFWPAQYCDATMPNEAALSLSDKQIDTPHDRISVVDAATSSSSFTLNDDLTPLPKRQRSLSPSSGPGMSQH